MISHGFGAEAILACFKGFGYLYPHMRRAAAISMLVLHLGFFTEVNELLRLPILVEHFFEHRSQAPEMSFFQFLAMHYETDVAHDATDMKLPFKACDHSVASPIFTVAEPFGLTHSLTSGTKQSLSRYISFIPSTGLDEIFQPPRA